MRNINKSFFKDDDDMLIEMSKLFIYRMEKSNFHITNCNLIREKVITRRQQLIFILQFFNHEIVTPLLKTYI